MTNPCVILSSPQIWVIRCHSKLGAKRFGKKKKNVILSSSPRLYASKLQLQEGMFSPVSSLVFCHFFKRLREFAVATGLISDLLVV